jgi:hypothetical protein
VKTLDHLGLNKGGTLRHYPPESVMSDHVYIDGASGIFG